MTTSYIFFNTLLLYMCVSLKLPFHTKIFFTISAKWLSNALLRKSELNWICCWMNELNAENISYLIFCFSFFFCFVCGCFCLYPFNHLKLFIIKVDCWTMLFYIVFLFLAFFVVFYCLLTTYSFFCFVSFRTRKWYETKTNWW